MGLGVAFPLVVHVMPGVPGKVPNSKYMGQLVWACDLLDLHTIGTC